MIEPIQIRMALAALGWSQRELAKRAGVHANTVQQAAATGGSHSSTMAVIENALIGAGVTLLPAGPDHGPGVALATDQDPSSGQG